MRSTLEARSDTKTILLTTYKRDGTPVSCAGPPAPDPAGDRLHRLLRYRTMHYELASVDP